MRQPLHRAGISALSVLTLGVGAIVSASPAQAASYWTAKNQRSGTCLTAGLGRSVFVSKCSRSTYQQWHTTGDPQYGFYLIQNRATGLCLTTGYRYDVNAVWQSACTKTRERRWSVGDTNGAIFNRDLESNVRTSPRAGAVYSDKHDNFHGDWNYYRWQRTFV